jgi:hypothetical protein
MTLIEVFAKKGVHIVTVQQYLGFLAQRL